MTTKRNNSNTSREDYRLNIRHSPTTSQKSNKILVLECHVKKTVEIGQWRKENVERGLGKTFSSLILFL
ncbi:hypothetical protein TanjilG_09902 [Lupinus angustifolius]|uniref:Uncharacterized protein n=1 Tax=Lupinus angustifolius TaxID=3871 RepID=A0A1J7H964_LUPAN|nr:hypothetical protein TanjilG_09902 [Lupinus angustifolius]